MGGSAITEATGRLRRPLTELLAAGPGLYIFVTPELDGEAVRAVLPFIHRPGMRLRVLTNLEPHRLVQRAGALEALAALLALPDCQVRGRADLGARVYLRVGGEALVGSAALTREGMDAHLEFGVRLTGAAAEAVAALVREWWEAAEPLGNWERLRQEVAAARDRWQLAAELSRIGVFIRLSVRGTRQTRRLDLADYGLDSQPRTLRSVQVELWSAPEVVRARDELERHLAEVGVEWAGHFLVPRLYAEQEWPRVFADRRRRLREWAASDQTMEAVAESLARARADMEAWFAALYGELQAAGRTPAAAPAAFARAQTDQLLADLTSFGILQGVGLEYRALQMVPEDERSNREVQELIRHPRFRSIQQIWPL